MPHIAPYEPRFVEFITASASTALTLDFSANGFSQAVPLTAASCTLTITPPKAITTWISIRLIQDATGSRVVVWPASVKGPAPTLSTAANASDLVLLFWNGTNFYFQAAAPVSSGVSSFNTRTGAVVSVTGDYAASNITNDSTVTGTGVAAALNTLKAASGVSSVYGRTGAVVAAAGDYPASKINNDSATVTGAHVSDALDSLKTLIAGGVTSAFGRTGAVVAVAGDYPASKINNDSVHVTGTHVSDALDSLYALIAASVTGVSSFNTRTGAVTPASGDYAASLVTNDSSVVGTTTKDALNTLKAASGVVSVYGRSGVVVATAGDYPASKINNDSATVTGTHVSDALDAIKAIAGVTSVFGRTGAISATVGDYVSSKISNDSTVTGTTVKDALNTLKGASGVTSVFGRTGVVVSVAGDYPASKINNDSATVTGTHVSDALDALLLQYQSAPTVTTSRAFVLADTGIVILANSASVLTFTVPANSTVAFKIGTRLSVLVIGTGGAGFTPAAGVTIDQAGSLPAEQFTLYNLDKIGTNTWLLSAAGSRTSAEIADASVFGGPTIAGSFNNVSFSISASSAALVPYTMQGNIRFPINRIYDGNNHWVWQSVGSAYCWQGDGTGQEFFGTIGVIPAGSTLIGIRIMIAPFVGHGLTLPGNMPRLKVYKFSASSGSVIGNVLDTSASVAAYETPHKITSAGWAGVPGSDDSAITWSLTDESGSNQMAGMKIISLEMILA